MFSQTVEYALRAMVVLANAPDNPQTAQSIAATAKLPIDYLFKVMQSLGKAGLVSAQRGKHGGFMLARDPVSLTILDVVNAVDPIRRIDSCPLNLKSHEMRLCALHRHLDSALALVEHAFSSTSLADLLNSSDPIRPLCESMVQVHAKTN
jgi:Rrf2 family transcriptional regulator, nitric oxide-sensitive transcriptional repressor